MDRLWHSNYDWFTSTTGSLDCWHKAGLIAWSHPVDQTRLQLAWGHRYWLVTVQSSYLSDCIPNLSAHSLMTSHVNKAFLSRQLLLTPCSLFWLRSAIVYEKPQEISSFINTHTSPPDPDNHTTATEIIFFSFILRPDVNICQTCVSVILCTWLADW